MKRTQFIRLTLLVWCFLGAVASTAAVAALPEFLPTGVKITSTTAAFKLESLGGETGISCTSGSSGGEITGEKTISKVKITFTGCTSSGFACTTPKAKSGELLTGELVGTLGFIKKGVLLAEAEIGILLTVNSGEIMEFDCAGGIVKVKVLGKVVCPISPHDSAVKEYVIVCEQSVGDQKPTKFEGGSTELILASFNGGSEAHYGFLTTLKIKTSVSSEIMA